MFDVYIGEINLANIVVIASVLAFFPLQLLLCFRVKSLLLRLIPVILFSLITLAFSVIATIPQDWSALFYIIIAVYSCFCLLVCLAAWIFFGCAKMFCKMCRCSRKEEQ